VACSLKMWWKFALIHGQIMRSICFILQLKTGDFVKFFQLIVSSKAKSFGAHWWCLFVQNCVYLSKCYTYYIHIIFNFVYFYSVWASWADDGCWDINYYCLFTTLFTAGLLVPVRDSVVGLTCCSLART